MNKKFVQALPWLLAVALLVVPQLAGATSETPTLSALGSVFGTTTLAQLIIRLVQVFLAFIGILVVGYLIYGGFIWQTAGGDPAKVEKAKNIILQTIIGLVIIFSSYAISAFLYSYFSPNPYQTCDPAVDECGSCDPSAASLRDCSTDAGLCAGTQKCLAAGAWSSCVKTNASCPSKQYAKLTDARSASLNWTRSYLPTGSAVLSVPAVSDLEIGGKAYNQGGSFSGMELWWGIAADTMAYTSDSSFVNVPTASELIAGVYAGLDGTALDAAATYKMRATALSSAGDIFSAATKFKVRPIYCFNNVLDKTEGETDIDCGGKCGACAGESCNASDTAGVCEADNSACRSGICVKDSCLCAAVPAITYVSPSVDINGDDDGHSASRYDDNIANGAAGNIITVTGKNFGTVVGQVILRSRSSGLTLTATVPSACAIPAACSASSSFWTNNQITVQIPSSAVSTGATADNQISSSTANYEIYVVTADGLSSLDNSSEANRSRLFEVDSISRASICNICPSKGVNPDVITISGYNLPATGGSVVWNFSAYDYAEKVWQLNNVTSTGSNWTTAAVNDTVPENRKGVTSLRIFNGAAYSNYYNFMISAGALGDPCGYDSSACSQDLSTCQSGLECSDDCACVKKAATKCVAGGVCDNGGCAGKYVCDSAGNQTCVANDSACVPYLGSASTRAIFSWAFSSYKKPTAGMSCASDLWGDGTCDLNGCLDSRLSCDIAGSDEQWLELYNPLASDIALTGWHLVIANSAAAEYNAALTADQNAAASGWTSVNLSTVAIAKKAFVVLDDLLPALPTADGKVFLIDGSNLVQDYLAYGGNGLEPGFSPASLGREIDGLHTGTTTDFSYFSNSTPGSTNNASQSTSTGAISINEISLAHDPCTCVPKGQLCAAGTTDATACAPIGQCKAVRKCLDNGHYGACVQENAACIPYLATPSSTIAIFAWQFGAGTGSGDAGPKVVSSCSGSADCSTNALPSPTPWESKWNASTKTGITNAKACLNAVISARFTAVMDEKSLTKDNIILYRLDGSSWTDVNSQVGSIAVLATTEAGKDYFVLNLNSTLAAGTIYRVVLKKAIQDEVGRKLIADANGVNGDNCSGSGITSDDKVCWDFTTRSSGEELYCDIGCISCTPYQYFNRYWGQESKQAVTPISKDNVCIMLDARKYDWQWYEEEQKNDYSDYTASKISTSDYWFIENSSDAYDYYSLVTDPESLASGGIGAQAQGGSETGHGTTTAETESKYTVNQDDESWFGSDDDYYFRITGRIASNQQYGSCKVHNNFTDPVVVENQYCTRDDDPSERVLQSPSPWKGQTDACTNADIFVLFSRNMLNSSLINVAANSLATDGSLKNIDVYACNSAAAATSSDYDTSSGCSKQSGWTGHIFSYTNKYITASKLALAAISASGSTTTEGIIILPPTGKTFNENAWYRVVIHGGSSGVRGANLSGSREVASGILQVPNSNARLVNAGDNNAVSYFWYFKTGAGQCAIDEVNVLPQNKFMSTLGETQNYNTDPVATNCNHLNPTGYDWVWRSLLNPNDDDQLCGTNSASGDGVASICSTDSATCESTDTALDLWQAKAFGKLEGTTNITARADKTSNSADRCEDKWGYGKLQVGYGGFYVISKSNADCLNSEISFTLSQEAKSVSAAGSTVRLYRCADDDGDCALDSATAVDFTLTYPSGLVGATINPDPTISNKVTLTADLAAGKTYRVVIMGGDGGLQSIFSTGLSNLNFSTAPLGATAYNSYSWTFKISDTAGVCSYVGIGLNPCPNGIWNVTAAADTASLNIDLYKGSDIGGDNCITDAQMRNLGFWRAAIDRIVRLVKHLLGFSSATAADYWCLVSTDAYSSSDLAKMRLGDFKKQITIDGANTTVSAYTENNDTYKINYIREANWATRTEYKAVVDYVRNGVSGRVTDQVFTYAQSCAINDIRFDVWPRGSSRKSDSFFCSSDPSSGKADECGRFSESVYDDDMSAVWTKAFPNNGYNVCADGSASANCDAYKSGNNHLYRLWALSGTYAVRGTFVDSANKVANISGTKTSSTKIATYNLADNNFFVTSGATPGRSLFNAYVSDPLDSTAGFAHKALVIYTYICSNPWPDAVNFPFVDSRSNCSALGTSNSTCINTNFGTYYCRDAGIEKTCVHGDSAKLGQTCISSSDCYGQSGSVAEGSCLQYTADDLPSIGNFNALSGLFGENSGIVTGSEGNSCNNLPADFKPTIGYLSVRDGLNYVWNNSGFVYANSSETGDWEEVNKSIWATNGLPGAFKPTFAVSQIRGGVAYDILFSSTEIYTYNSSIWQKDKILPGKLPSGFWPAVGAVSGHQLFLADKSGRLVIVTYNNSTGAIESVSSLTTIKNPSGTVLKPKVMVSVDGGVVLIDGSNDLYLRSSSASDWLLQTTADMPSTLSPVFSSALSDDEFVVWIEPTGYIFRRHSSYWEAIASASLNNVVCDNKVKDFLFAGLVSSSSQPITVKGSASQTVTDSNGFVAVGSQLSTSDNSAVRMNAGGLRYNITVPAAGKYYVTLETSNSNDSLVDLLPVGYGGAYGTCAQGANLKGNSFYQSLSVDIDGAGTSTISALASDVDNHQYNKTANEYTLAAGMHTINIAWTNDCFCYGSSCAWGDADMNLRLYSVKLSSASAAANDAIGIRVYNNSSHLSPAAWYKARFSGDNLGSLSDVSIDGYSGGTEGTSAYVNASDFSDSHGSIYTDMFVLSYNSGATSQTENIFTQLLSNMFFNAGTMYDGGVDDAPFGHCSGGSATDDANLCYSDLDCEKRGVGHCDSIKAKATRDTQRLADIQDIIGSVDDYYSILRCSNDLSRTCKTTADCYGSGSCGNFKPKLVAGTYIVGRTNSAWPSWQKTLGEALGVTLPVDPINQLYTTVAGEAAKCYDPYDVTTCWDATNKTMPMSGGICQINDASSVYVYNSPQNSSSSRLYIKGELYADGSHWQPAWNVIPGLNYNPFAGYNASGLCYAIKDTCGNGQDDSGEDCSNCSEDAGCGIGQKCQKNSSGYWVCGDITSCGDGETIYPEECDLGAFGNIVDNGCTPGFCTCVSGWDCSDPAHPQSICGDGLVVGDEGCDEGEAKNGVSGSGCNADCSCASGYDCSTPSNPVKLCGNGIVNTGEVCDEGSNNGVSGSGCNTDCTCEDDYDCSSGSPVKKCGNGIIDTGEICDNGSSNGTGGCAADCTCASTYTCNPNDNTQVLTADCGNGALEGSEECDFDASGNPIVGCTESGCCNAEGATNECQFNSSWEEDQVCHISAFTVNGSSGDVTIASGGSASVVWDVVGTSPYATVSATGLSSSNTSGSQTLTGITGTRSVTLSACGETRTITIYISSSETNCSETLTVPASATVGASMSWAWTLANSSDVAYTISLNGTTQASGNQSGTSGGGTYAPTAAGTLTVTITNSCAGTTAKSVTVSSAETTVVCGDGAVASGSEACDCGDSGTYYSGTLSGNAFSCYINSTRIYNGGSNFVKPWTLSQTWYSICASDCSYITGAYGRYCGDGIITTANEACDWNTTSQDKCCSKTSCQKIKASSALTTPNSWDGVTYCDVSGSVCASPKVLNASGQCVTVAACDGDGVCDSGETAANCIQDCHCGNGSCESSYGETAATCSNDCKCGNGVIDSGEVCDCSATSAIQTAWSSDTKASSKYCQSANGVAATPSYTTAETHYYNCNSSCTAASYHLGTYCGDGIQQSVNGEDCDTGSYRGEGHGCTLLCTITPGTLLWWWTECRDSTATDGNALKCWGGALGAIGSWQY